MIQCLSEHLSCFITLTGEKCTCVTMQSDFIVQKMSRNMAKMKMCGLYRPEKIQKYGSMDYTVQNSVSKKCPLRTLVTMSI